MTMTLNPPQVRPAPIGSGPAQGPGRAAVNRLARREISQHKGRSLLIVLLILIPVAAMCVTGIQSFSASSPEAELRTAFGSAAHRLVYLGNADGSCEQVSRGITMCADDQSRGLEMPQLVEAIPAGHTGVPTSSMGALAQVRWDGADFGIPVAVLDAHNPLALGMVRRLAAAPLAADQVWATGTLLERFSLTVGDRVRVNGAGYTIADELAVPVGPMGQAGLVVPFGHPLARDAGIESVLLDGPLLDDATLTGLNHRGIAIQERRLYMDGDPNSPGRPLVQVMSQVVALVMVALACMLTATVAGAAFAIGVRQQRRSLALIAAIGATGTTLRRIVLRNGAFLGLIGASVGVAVGVPVGWWLVSSTPDAGVPTIPWLMIAGTWAIGAVSAVLAASAPAHQIANQDTLAGVRSADLPSPPAPFPVLGTALVAVGLGCGALGLLLSALHRGPVTSSDLTRIVLPGLAGCVALFTGSLLTVGWLIDRIGRLAGGPLGLRLALRDAARNRQRASAGAAALLAIATLASAGMVAQTSGAATDRMHYVPVVPPGWATVQTFDSGGQRLSDITLERTIRALDSVLGPIKATVRPKFWQPMGVSSVPDGEFWNVVMSTNTSTGASEPAFMMSDVLVAEEDELELLFGGLSRTERQVLAEGGALVTDPAGLNAGHVTLRVERLDQTGVEPSMIEVAGLARAPMQTAGAWMTPQGVARAGLPAAKWTVRELVQLDHTPTRSEVDRAAVAVQRQAGVSGIVTAELGPQDPSAGARLGFGLFCLGLMVAVSAVVIGLTLTDSRGTYRTLSAIGAGSWTLRSMSAVQAFVTTFVGIGLGWAAGTVPMLLMIGSSGGYMAAEVPWLWLAVYLAGVPVLSAGMAWVFARPPAPRAVRVD